MAVCNSVPAGRAEAEGSGRRRPPRPSPLPRPPPAAHLQGKDFPRIRIGIGRPPGSMPVVSWVLQVRGRGACKGCHRQAAGRAPRSSHATALAAAAGRHRRPPRLQPTARLLPPFCVQDLNKAEQEDIGVAVQVGGGGGGGRKHGRLRISMQERSQGKHASSPQSNQLHPGASIPPAICAPPPTPTHTHTHPPTHTHTTTTHTHTHRSASTSCARC